MINLSARPFRRFLPSLLGASCLLLASLSPVKAMDYEEYPVVKLRSLDKITARTMTFEVKVGSTVRFGEIFIKVQACRKPPPVEKSEAAAFLQVWQNNGDTENTNAKWIFSGWMFASSPALSSMDHPVYDVWVLDCLGRDPEPLPKVSDTGVQPPVTDGAAPNAVPPAVEPDTAAKLKENTVTKDDDPGAFDEETTPNTSIPANSVPQETTPATNATPAPAENKDYKPDQDTPETYKDDTPADDSAPKEDTIPATPAPAPVPQENLEPKPEPEKTGQEIQGIY